MVVCNSPAGLELDLKSKLAAQWEDMMELRVTTLGPSCTEAHTAVLIRPHQQLRCPLLALPSQHLAALSDFVDKHRHTAKVVSLWGPLVGCTVTQSLTHDSWPQLQYLRFSNSSHLDSESLSHLLYLSLVKEITIVDCFLDAAALQTLSTGWSQLQCVVLTNNQLDGNALAPLPQANWPHLCDLDLNIITLGLAGVQHLVSFSWPHLRSLTLRHTNVDVPALQSLAHGKWPVLEYLNLRGNNVNATGVVYLVQGMRTWLLLQVLCLSAQDLDEEACLLLGIVEASEYGRSPAQQLDVVPSKAWLSYRSALPQVSKMHVVLTDESVRL